MPTAPVSRNPNPAKTLVDGVFGDRSKFTTVDLVMEAALPDKAVVGFFAGGTGGFLYGLMWDAFEAPVNWAQAIGRIAGTAKKPSF